MSSRESVLADLRDLVASHGADSSWSMALLSLLPSMVQRDFQLERRNDAIRAAANALFGHLRPTPRAEALCSALRNYAASAWRAHSHVVELPQEASPQHRLLHNVMRLSGGKVLEKRQINYIITGRQ